MTNWECIKLFFNPRKKYRLISEKERGDWIQRVKEARDQADYCQLRWLEYLRQVSALNNVLRKKNKAIKKLRERLKEEEK